MGGDRCLEGVEQAPEPGRPLSGLGYGGMAPELVDALVEPVGGVEEGERVAGVDETGRPSAPAASQTGASSGSSVITRLPFAVADRPRSFHTLSPRAPLLADRSREPTRASVAFGCLQQPPIEMAERVEATRMRVVEALEVVFELAVPTPVEVDQPDEVAVVHDAQQIGDVGCHPTRVGSEPTPEMRVRVDRGNARGGNGVLGQLEHRTGFEAVESRKRPQHVSRASQHW